VILGGECGGFGVTWFWPNTYEATHVSLRQLVSGSGEGQDREVLSIWSWSGAAIQSSARGCLRDAEYRRCGPSHKHFSTLLVPEWLLMRWLQLDVWLGRSLRIS